LVGPISVTALGTRWGRTAPLMIGLVGTAISCVCIGEARNMAAYGIALVFNNAIWWFAYSYIMGLASLIDRRGLLVSVAGGTYIVGSASGTALAGLIATELSYRAIGLASGAVCLAGVVAVWRIARQADKRSTASVTAIA
jgi:predicted MFS family arabinose efflux permease